MTVDVETVPLTAADRPAELPTWYPGWARELADAYYSGATSLFILHGNVHDLIRCETDAGEAYLNLSEFLASQIFGRFDVVLYYDLARGLRPLADSTKRLQNMMQFLAPRLGGEPNAWPRDPEQVLLLLDRLLERNLLEEDPSRRKSIAIILGYSQLLVPDGDLAMMARGHGTHLVRFLSWAKNPYLKRVNVAFCLIADNLMEVNDRLVQSEHVEDVEIPLPDRNQRERFCSWMARGQDLNQLTEFSIPQLAELSNGLSLTSLKTLLAQGKTGRRLDAPRFKQLKKTLIERQCQGLLEFVEPPHTLDLVVGQEAAKQRLRQDAELITQGCPEAAPMGYLICGPVGTGKTFLAECYAGSIGIPCVKLRNFRSKYVGETEGNLERVLTVLRSLGPVVVLVDEADAALGTRQTDGDSGTSSRVFAMIANQMGDTRYRGKIIWMLLTSRPDLLPVDLKRQGRAEVHIPLFYPQDANEFREMFRVMGRKNKVKLSSDALSAVRFVPGLSGSDIESILLGAKRDCLSAGRDTVEAADLERAVAEFLPSAQSLEKEMQEIAAVLECTQMSFLPARWQERLAQPDSRARLQERLVALRQILEK